MKLKRKFNPLACAIIQASVIYMPLTSADMFELGVIEKEDLLTLTVNGLEGMELKTCDLYNGDFIIVKKYPTTGYANSFTAKCVITEGILSNYTYSVAVKKVLSCPFNNGNYSQYLATAPIPEPGEWELVFVGIGLAGYQIRRKQKLLNHSRVG